MNWAFNKSVERSKNIRGDIVQDLWTAYSKITGALESIVHRADKSGDGATANLPTDGDKKRERWEEERNKLNKEIAYLRSRNALLEGGLEK